jgi:hypothetical protein
MRFSIFLVTALAAIVLAAPTPEGDSSNDVGCCTEVDNILCARCVGIEVGNLNNDQSNFNEPLLIFFRRLHSMHKEGRCL